MAMEFSSSLRPQCFPVTHCLHSCNMYRRDLVVVCRMRWNGATAKKAAANITTSPFLWKRSRRMQNPSPQVKMEMVPTRNFAFACIDRCEHDSEGTSYALCKLDRLALPL